MNKNFEDQFTETSAIIRHDQTRDSKSKSTQPTVVSQQQTPQPSIQKPQPGADNLKPSYIKVPLPLNTNNNSDNRYLEPIAQKQVVNKTNDSNTYNQSTSYLQPTNKPLINTNNKPTSNQSGYLEPTQQSRVDDTYGGAEGTQYYMNESIKQDTYINEDFINDLKNTPRRPLIAEEEDDRIGDSYLIPRIGSNISKASSTAPLIGKTSRSSKNTYAPSPPLPEGKFSTFRSNETDV